MDVFISWSGDKSKQVARVLRDWLPNVIQVLTPYFTSNDIEKGRRWSQGIAEKLNDSQFGIILVTKNNINAPWILFEAGALSKNVGVSHVCPLLLDLKPTDLTGPLVQFQATMFDKEEVRKLISTINSSIKDNPLSESTLNAAFNKWWPELEEGVEAILNTENNKTDAEIRTERDLIEEVLRLVRQRAYSSFESDNKFFESLTYKPVTFDKRTKNINVWFHQSSPYQIELERIDSGAALADFILQINNKGICKAEHVKAFLDCIEDLSDRYFQKKAQGVFCPGGINQNVEWPNE